MASLKGENSVTDPQRTIAFQGMPGAYSHAACKAARPDFEPLACNSFEDMLLSVQEGRAALAMVPVENSVAGRVADIHHLLPESGLHIIGEHFQRVNHMLLGLKGAKISDIRSVKSHTHALAQCRKLIRDLDILPVISADTAGSAAEIAAAGDPSVGAIASALAAELNDLQILRTDVEDAVHNTTRFLIMARESVIPPLDDTLYVTTIVFRVRSVPAALYKALGGFATNGINLTKLESYLVEGSFSAAQFYVDAEGHPETSAMKMALEELRFFCPEDAVQILGTYPAADFRR
ncbi:MAG: prephenate dehydratase [Nisaea sp.]|jgi:prephenate dehydratase|nr:prephenate dehydratase [Nisaea sp.]OUX91431.1 MAG: prephenate dehydratase [Candidatus Endolissoclinum sp. TMED26]